MSVRERERERERERSGFLAIFVSDMDANLKYVVVLASS